jgi:hypothetical protein
LIHAKHGKEVMDYLMERLKTHQDEVVLHGAALGLGMAGMASNNEGQLRVRFLRSAVVRQLNLPTPIDTETYDEIRTILFQDSSVAGEAAGYAMGLIMLGSGSEKALDEMLQYARETQHEKIIRGLAMGIAFLMYGRAELADSVIDQLLAEKVSIASIRKNTGAYSMFHNRTPFYDTVACSLSLWLTREPLTTRRSASCSTSLSRMLAMTFDELLLPRLGLSCSATTSRSRESYSFSARATTHMFDMVLLLLWEYRVRVLGLTWVADWIKGIS